MRAVLCKSYGPPPDLEVTSMEPPALKPGCVMMDVHACGFGFPDALRIAGKHQYKHELPFIPGTEAAGIVTEVAADLINVKPGARVLCLLGIGGLAEKAVTPIQNLIALPEQMPFSDAAALFVNYGTTYYALVQRARLQASESLLVLGASGGAGLAAVQLGKALGARVIACASTAEKLELARESGADELINYSLHSLKTEVMARTDGRGVDVIYDPVGGPFTEQAIRCAAWNSRLLVIGFATGTIPSIPLNLPLLKGCSIIGIFWGTHKTREPQQYAANTAALLDLYSRGMIRPKLTELEGLESIGDIVKEINGRRAAGKFVVKIATAS